MWMRFCSCFPIPDFLEPVDVITQLSSPKQTGICHVVQIPECGRFVDSIGVQSLSHIGVRHRRLRFSQ